MEADPNNRSNERPPTFGEILHQVVAGTMLGFTVFDREGDITYTFMASLGVGPTADETWIPITPESAQTMLTDLANEAPDELNEYGALEERTITS